MIFLPLFALSPSSYKFSVPGYAWVSIVRDGENIFFADMQISTLPSKNQFYQNILLGIKSIGNEDNLVFNFNKFY